LGHRRLEAILVTQLAWVDVLATVQPAFLNVRMGLRKRPSEEKALFEIARRFALEVL
jgi:hypothetical protein